MIVVSLRLLIFDFRHEHFGPGRFAAGVVAATADEHPRDGSSGLFAVSLGVVADADAFVGGVGGLKYKSKLLNIVNNIFFYKTISYWLNSKFKYSTDAQKRLKIK
jgi:hypothetical protein